MHFNTVALKFPVHFAMVRQINIKTLGNLESNSLSKYRQLNRMDAEKTFFARIFLYIIKRMH